MLNAVEEAFINDSARARKRNKDTKTAGIFALLQLACLL